MNLRPCDDCAGLLDNVLDVDDGWGMRAEYGDIHGVTPTVDEWERIVVRDYAETELRMDHGPCEDESCKNYDYDAVVEYAASLERWGPYWNGLPTMTLDDARTKIIIREISERRSEAMKILADR